MHSQVLVPIVCNLKSILCFFVNYVLYTSTSAVPYSLASRPARSKLKFRIDLREVVEKYKDYPRPPALYCCVRNILTVLRGTLT
jgi:hypothetical protein